MSGTAESVTTEATKAQETEVIETTSETKAEPKVFDEQYVKSLRDEAARHRTEKQAERVEKEALKTKLAEYERAQLSEKERFELEFDEAKTKSQKLQAQMQETLLEAAVAKNVRKFDLTDSDATFKLLDKSSIEFGEDGRPSNIDEVLAATLEKYPFLKLVPEKKAAVDPGSTNPGKPRNGGGLTVEAVRTMPEAERQSRMPEIMAWMAAGGNKK